MSESVGPNDPRIKPLDISTLPFVPIPEPASDDAVIRVSMINSNLLEAPKATMCRNGEDYEEKLYSPCYSFILERKDGSVWFWDLGMRPDVEALPPSLENILKIFKVAGSPKPEVFEQASQKGLDISKVKGAILSHQHWDRDGNLDALPEGLPLILGPTTLASIQLGYPEDPNSKWYSRWFKELNIIELPGVEVEGEWKGKVKEVAGVGEGKALKWEKVGPFEKAVDFFGDGSMWLADSPGHCPGHMTCLVRTTANPATYVLLGGDACHHQSNYLPVPTCSCPDQRTSLPFFPYAGPDKPLTSMHSDILASVKTIGQLTKLSEREEVMIMLAHEQGARDVLPEYPETISDWKEKGYKERKEERLLKDLKEKGRP